MEATIRLREMFRTTALGWRGLPALQSLTLELASDSEARTIGEQARSTHWWAVLRTKYCGIVMGTGHYFVSRRGWYYFQAACFCQWSGNASSKTDAFINRT